MRKKMEDISKIHCRGTASKLCSRIIVSLTLIILLMTTGCERTPRLYIFNWAYYMPDSIIRQFEQEFNVRVVYDEFASNDEMFARLLAAGARRSFDIVFPSSYFVPIMMQHNMLHRIDRSLIPNLANIDPEITAKMIYDPYMDYSVPYFFGAGVIAVNTARVPEFEKSWSIFAREDLRERMTMLDDIRDVFAAALITLGHSVNTTDPVIIEEARNFINNTWRPNLLRFDGATYGRLFANEEVWVVHAFAEDVFYEIVGNTELLNNTVFFIPQEGAPAYIDTMVILRNARNVDLAHKFIDFIHRPEIYAEFVDTFSLPSTVNIPAREFTTAVPIYTLEDLENTELVQYIGPAIRYFNEAWFNSIRVGL